MNKQIIRKNNECSEKRDKIIKKTNRFWNIPLTSHFNHLNGKTWSRNIESTFVLTKEGDIILVVWTLAM
jgi:hypothetical protein